MRTDGLVEVARSEVEDIRYKSMMNQGVRLGFGLYDADSINILCIPYVFFVFFRKYIKSEKLEAKEGMGEISFLRVVLQIDSMIFDKETKEVGRNGMMF